MHEQATTVGAGRPYAAWADEVAELASLIEALEPAARAVGAPEPERTEWHGALFGKLRPQVAREPVLVAAVCGGTNTGTAPLQISFQGFQGF